MVQQVHKAQQALPVQMERQVHKAQQVLPVQME
jgi:hypothetical protein